jgi:hypothetical protein
MLKNKNEFSQKTLENTNFSGNNVSSHQIQFLSNKYGKNIQNTDFFDR